MPNNCTIIPRVGHLYAHNNYDMLVFFYLNNFVLCRRRGIDNIIRDILC